MKNAFHLPCWLLLFLALVCSGCSDSLNVINEEISSVNNSYVPDSRTDIYYVQAERGRGDTIILRGETTIGEAKQTLIKSLSDKGINLIDSIITLPDTTVNKRYWGLATLSVINLRREPDHASELVSQAILGTPVMVLKNQGSWLLVRTPDRYISWTEGSSVRKVSTMEMNEWKNSDRVIYEKNTGWIYSNIAETGIIGDVVSGCILARLSETQGYARVVLPDGREGFVRSLDIIPFKQFCSAADATGENIIKRAETLSGVPYLWGGSSSKGVDCSGFVQTVCFMNGLIIARDASQQARYGDSVDISKDFSALRTGDLLFFGSPEKITHVAIYKGNTEYIHSSGRVMVNSLDSTRNNYSSYRRSSLVKAVRISGSSDPGIVRIEKHPWY